MEIRFVILNTGRLFEWNLIILGIIQHVPLTQVPVDFRLAGAAAVFKRSSSYWNNV